MIGGVVVAAMRRHWALWLGLTLTFVGGYYLVLLATVVLRFRDLPNYLTQHDLGTAYRLILEGTPRLTDTLPLLAAEPWLEVGFRNPDYYGIAEWSLFVIPGKALLIAALAALLATYLVLRRHACTPTRGADAAAGTGAALIAVAGATLTWVVCCAGPSWIVVLAMLGLSASLALTLEPLGDWLIFLGMALLVLAILQQARAFQPVFPPPPHKRTQS